VRNGQAAVWANTESAGLLMRPRRHRTGKRRTPEGRCRSLEYGCASAIATTAEKRSVQPKDPSRSPTRSVYSHDPARLNHPRGSPLRALEGLRAGSFVLRRRNRGEETHGAFQRDLLYTAPERGHGWRAPLDGRGGPIAGLTQLRWPRGPIRPRADQAQAIRIRPERPPIPREGRAGYRPTRVGSSLEGPTVAHIARRTSRPQSVGYWPVT
jgi:hypothetical protein